MASYANAPPEYFTDFDRGGRGVHKILQLILPKFVVSAKNRYFSWVQALYVIDKLAGAGLLKGSAVEFDVADVGSGLPILGEELAKEGIKAVSVDPNTSLSEMVARDSSRKNSFITSNTTDIPLKDKSVTMAVSHNYLQKSGTPEIARTTLEEMMRIATDSVVVQVMPSENLWFGVDATHNLVLSAGEWHQLVSETVQGSEWRLSEVHRVRVADAIPVGRPPVFVLERRNHPENRADYTGLRRSTKIALCVERETTFANAISLTRPLLAAYVLHELEGVAKSAAIGGVMALDAVDGWVARRFGPSPLGKHVDRIADHIVAAIAYFSLGYPLLGIVNAARDAVVDVVSFHADEKATNRRTVLSRAGYGLVKTATFVTAPVSYVAGGILAGISTAFSFYRAADLFRGMSKNGKS
ncbi:TPA: methyltransferase domain-containing protein [Candidatus Woesearchaeota archaeon]|nr:methyltransferase domain-containing protein [Candidatus Woesearchaeota archaeon]